MIWVTGCSGMLGREIILACGSRGCKCIGTDRELDICDTAAVQNFITVHKPTILINCAAYTAVDKAEAEKDLAYKVNAEGVGVLAIASNAAAIPLIHFSTDYVFDGLGSAPWLEDGRIAPLSVYGASKARGEELIREHNFRHLIIRISWLYGLHGSNFIKTMIRLFKEKPTISVVNDQIGAPTWTKPLAEQIVMLAQRGIPHYGTFHYQDSGAVSWYDVAIKTGEIAEKCSLVGHVPPIIPIASDQYPTPAKRPLNSRLDTQRTKRLLGFTVRPWNENLSQFIQELKGSAT